MRRFLIALTASLALACTFHITLLAQSSRSADQSASAPASSAPATSVPAQTAPASSAPATSPATSRAATNPTSIPTKEEIIRRAQQAEKTNRRIAELFKAAKYDQARDMLLNLTRMEPDNYIVWYNLACAYSRLSETDNALSALTRSMEYGYTDFPHLQRDSDLDNIRTTDAYKSLMARRDEFIQTSAEKMLKSLRQRFGNDYIYELDKDNKLVVATNIDKTTLDDLKARLKAQAEALWTDLFPHKFDQYVTVVISKTQPADMGNIGGFYNHAEHILVAKTVGMTVVHEFTHALHAADQSALGQEHPIWILEGLATLFESSQVRDGHIIPQENHRLTYLQNLAARKQLIPWSDLFKFDQSRFMARAIVAYPEARYIFMYLYRKGKLKAWYNLYTEGFEKDPTGTAALEKVFGKKLPDIEHDWIAWMKEQDAPPVAIPRGHAYIGVRTQGQTDGLNIIQVVPDSGAEKAGLRAGDTIYKVSGRETIDPEDLIILVDEHSVGDKILIEYRRDGKYYKTLVTLGAMPQLAATDRPGNTSKPANTGKPAETKPSSAPTTDKATSRQTTRMAA